MSTSTFLQSLRWKREYKSDREKYLQSFRYQLSNPSKELVIEQQPFESEGFASTVWDSAIVMAKYLEKHREMVCDRRCLDLSAGCGLVAIVMSHLHPRCTLATDLTPNLSLLKRNCLKNASEECEVQVVEHSWGEDLTGSLLEPCDLVVACDVMYSISHVSQLIASLEKFIENQTKVLVCYGRNASAEESFLRLGDEKFNIKKIDWAEFDSMYRSEEISCLELTKKPSV